MSVKLGSAATNKQTKNINIIILLLRYFCLTFFVFDWSIISSGFPGVVSNHLSLNYLSRKINNIYKEGAIAIFVLNKTKIFQFFRFLHKICFLMSKHLKIRINSSLPPSPICLANNIGWSLFLKSIIII